MEDPDAAPTKADSFLFQAGFPFFFKTVHFIAFHHISKHNCFLFFFKFKFNFKK